MQQPAIFLLLLLAAVGVLLVLSKLSRLPYPIVLVVGGILLGFAPGLPGVQLRPDVILLLVLPPLVFYAALQYQARRLRENISTVTLLALGLLIGTMAGVAVVAHALIGLPWGVAFVLGAVLSPTDPVSATAITARVGAPRRVASVLEGESLLNDGAALTLYGIAISVVVAGDFSLGSAALKLPINILGGIAIGLLVAWLMSWALLRRLGSGYHITVLTLLTAYLSYLCADVAGTSGVLAAVAAGMYIGRRMPVDQTPNDRIGGYAFFEVLVFSVNTLVFILMGLQFPMIMDKLSGRPAMTVLVWSLAINAVVFGARLVWCMGFGQIVFRIDPTQRHRYADPPWRQSLVIGCAGMRGAVSLAAALAIPLQLADGSVFPGRDRIVFLTTTVIFTTVVIQGLLLPVLIRGLGLGGGSDSQRADVRRARRLGGRAALKRVEQLREEDWLPEGVADLLRQLYSQRANALAESPGQNEDDEQEEDEDEVDYRARYDALLRLQGELIDAERSELLRLNRAGEISDSAMRRVEHDLDLEALRFKK